MQRVLRSGGRSGAARGAVAMVLLTVMFSLVASARPAMACSCIEPPPPQQALGEADAVFAGEVVDIGRTRDEFEIEVVLAVSQVWKGGIVDRQALRTESDSAMCGFPFQPGEEYMVYASKGDDGFRTSLCSRTVSLTAAAEDLAALGDARAPAASPDEPAGSSFPWIVAAAAVAALGAAGAVLWRRRRPASQ